MNDNHNLDEVTEQALQELSTLLKDTIDYALREALNAVKYPAINLLKGVFDRSVADTKRKIIYRIMVL